MKLTEHKTIYGTILVEECTRKEFVELAQQLIDEVRYWEDMTALAGLDASYYADMDMAMTITYKDGTECSYHDGFGIEGKFRRTGIVYGEISNAATYQVFGAYAINDDGICNPA